MKIRDNKKGVEMTLQTIVILILCSIALIIILYFFVTRYGGGADTISSVGKNAIDQVANS